MSCSVYPQPDTAFSNTDRTCSHPRIDSARGGRAQPQEPFDSRSKVRPTDSRYLHFSQLRATESLNLRHEDRKDVGVFPRNIYAKHPFASSVSHSIQPRDRNTHYTYSPDSDDKERSEHTPWQSRYGYDRFPNEYGVGSQSRGYIEPPECHECGDVPHDMAPVRFYSEKHLGSSTSEFRDDAEQFRTPVCLG